MAFKITDESKFVEDGWKISLMYHPAYDIKPLGFMKINRN